MDLTHKTVLNNIASEVAAELSKKLSEFGTSGARDGRPVLLFVSGGSALAVLDLIDVKSLPRELTVSVLDERWSADPKVNNFLQLAQTEFYKKASDAGALFITTAPTAGESQQEMADRWSQDITRWRATHPDGYALTIMGIGEDGHTSGIMPAPENERWFLETFDTANKWVAAYDAADKNQYPLRVTTTLSFLKDAVDEAVVYVCGAKKKAVVEKILLGKGELSEYPARVIHLMKKVTVYTDFEVGGEVRDNADKK